MAEEGFKRGGELDLFKLSSPSWWYRVVVHPPQIDGYPWYDKCMFYSIFKVGVKLLAVKRSMTLSWIVMELEEYRCTIPE